MSLTQQELHEKVLYPVVRVRSRKAGGSGVIIYSQPDPKHPDHFLNFALTCEHVVDDAIQIKEDWDAVLKTQRKKDFFEEVTIELFDYDGSRIVSANATQADIFAYDKHHDLAVVRLHNHRQLSHIASFIPENAINELKLFDPVWTSGCSLLHDPFSNPGTLTFLREVIEQKAYLMANAPSVFGNSGGGLFHGGSGHLLGLTSRITTIDIGFGFDVMTWMGFSTHPSRLYEFFREQELHFLFDPSDTYYASIERREKRKRDAQRLLVERPAQPEHQEYVE